MSSATPSGGPLTDEEVKNAVKTPDPSTCDFIFQQTMYRIKDPKASLAFYTGVLGMYLLKKLDFPEMKFSLYFLGFVDASKIPADETERTRWCFQQVCGISTYLLSFLSICQKENTVVIKQERHKVII